MMHEGKMDDAVISGSGQLAGGRYENIRISGSGNINGDIYARDIKAAGSARFAGNVAARSFKASGSFSCQGGIQTDECKVSGSGRVHGHLHARYLKVSGSLVCREGIRAEEVRCSGNLQTDRNVEAETFKASGAVEVRGLLNANRIELTLYGSSRIQEIGGDEVVVRTVKMNPFWWSVRKFFDMLGWGNRIGLRSETIEATRVSLEWTTARAVRGDEVTIGPGCHIDLVEYTTVAHIDMAARVKEVRRIGTVA